MLIIIALKQTITTYSQSMNNKFKILKYTPRYCLLCKCVVINISKGLCPFIKKVKKGILIMGNDKTIEQFHMSKKRYQLLHEEVSKIKVFVDSKNLNFIGNYYDKQKTLDKLESLFEEAYYDNLLEEIHYYPLGDALIYVDEVKRERFTGNDLSKVLEAILNGITAGLEKVNKKEVEYKVQKVFMEHAKKADKNFFIECAKHASEIATIIDISIIAE